MNKIYSRVGIKRPRRSVFDLSYVKTFDADMGLLYPVLCEEMVPGDKFKIGNQIVIRFQPLVAPILHEINVTVHYFFVPYRILDENWEQFITGGVDGTHNGTIPRWTPTGQVPSQDVQDLLEPYLGYRPNIADNAVGSLWDYLGFPVNIIPNGAEPMAYPKMAYVMIWNEYYRDQNLLQNELDLNGCPYLLPRAWEKDYFTSALPWPQRGIAPALPITGLGSAVWPQEYFNSDAPSNFQINAQRNYTNAAGGTGFARFTTGTATKRDDIQNLFNTFNANTIDFSNVATFNASDIRLVFQIQKWMETNARTGVRYTEFLHGHFSVSPRDERLDRPEYIGGSKSPIIVSEVLQTSDSQQGGTPQGNMAGHAITADSTYCGTYYAEEYGLVMGLMSIMPRTMYQQGINRQWLRRTRYDFYFPEFANLSEQAVENAEIFASDDATQNQGIFGYQGRYNEMRSKDSMVCGNMRSNAPNSLAYWHLGRFFANKPNLNWQFVCCSPAETKRIFAVQNVPGIIVSFGNKITGVRMMPVEAVPGFIDH